MATLARDTYAILELVAVQPVAIFPERHGQLVRELAREGLIMKRGERWYPTARGLALAGHTLH